MRNIQVSHLLHEIRAPLARMRIALTLLTDGPQQSVEDIDRLGREIERIERMMNEIIDCEKLTWSLQGGKHEVLSLARIIKDIVLDLRYEATHKDVTVQMRLDDTIEVSGSALWLKRAIENVLRNSLTHGKGVSIIRIEMIRRGKNAHVVLLDDGEGVADPDLDRIFEPFYRGAQKDGISSDGTGLGLTIVRSVIGHHGGKVRAENAKPGLRIIIDLPAIKLPRQTNRLPKVS